MEAGTTQPQNILPEPYSEITPESSLYRSPTVTPETYHVCEWYNRILLSRTFPGFFVFTHIPQIPYTNNPHKAKSISFI